MCMARVSNETIVAALLTYPTNVEAAKAVGLSERSLYDRMKSPAFKNLYAEQKDKIVDCALDQAQRALLKSINVMVEVMEDSTAAPQIRLNAAEAIQRSMSRLSKTADDENPFASIDRMLRR